jgi:hypothetical protein
VFFLSQGLLINEENHSLVFFSFLLIGTSKVSTIEQEKSNDNHYDRPKFHNLEKILISVKSQTPRLSIQRQANCLIDDVDFDNVENTNSTKQNNKYYKGNIAMTYDKVSVYSYACLCLFFFFFFFFSLLYILS